MWKTCYVVILWLSYLVYHADCVQIFFLQKNSEQANSFFFCSKTPSITNISTKHIINHIFVFILQMHLVPMIFVLNSIFVVWTLAGPIPKPEPGHMVIDYYKERALEAKLKSYEKIKFKCQSQLNSAFGVVYDPECQEWFEFYQYRSSANSNSIPKISTTIALVLVSTSLMSWWMWWFSIPKIFKNANRVAIYTYINIIIAFLPHFWDSELKYEQKVQYTYEHFYI